MIILIVVILLMIGVLIMSAAKNKPKVEIVSTYFCGKKIWINKAYKNKFDAANLYLIIYNPELVAQVHRVDSYNARYILGSVVWSYHAYGQAIDINPEEFFKATTPYPLPAWYQEFGLIMIGQGFRWGKNFLLNFDPMHFEIGERT